VPSVSPKPNRLRKLGIIAGGGPLPGRVIEACRAQGRPVFVIGIKGAAEPETIGDAPHAIFRLGAGRRAVNRLRAEGVEDVLFIGRLRRPGLIELMPDPLLMSLILRFGWHVLFKGDESILKAIVWGAGVMGFGVVGIHEILPDLLATEGVYGRVTPDREAEADIARGIAAALDAGARDRGQAAVVRGGAVVGIEDRHGTDALIRRCDAATRNGAGGVLVKVKKPQQQRHIDLPTIGVTTVENAARAGLAGIAVEAGSALVVDRPAVIEAADRAGLFVVGVRVPQ
jgi:DUF1009 family protein